MRSCKNLQNMRIKWEISKSTKYANVRYNEKREIRGVSY
jgi:hypothetical protein